MSNLTFNSPEEEQKLIQQYKVSGDLGYLGKLFNPYMHLVYGLCLKYFKNREESQDAVMQVFEKLIDSVKHHEVANFKSWLYVLSKNHCLMTLRSKQYQNEKITKDISESSMENTLMMHHNDEPALEEDLGRLEKCIDELHIEQKQCIKLFYLESKSYKEIETLTNFEMKKVKSHIQNGKRNLKICMERKGEE